MENINISSPNDGLGDKVRNAFDKINQNFNEVSQEFLTVKDVTDAKLDKSPNDGILYGQKDGVLTAIPTSGGGAVDSVNGKTGVVVLDASNIAETATKKYVSPTEKNTWNAKQSALGFTPEDISNKKTTLTNNNTDYPTTKAVKDALANKQSISPTDGKTYGLKDGGIIEILPSDALIIADSVQSASVTGALTLVKEYDLGILGDRCLLTYDFGFTSTISAAEAYTVYMYLFNGTTESVISRYILPTNSNYCGISRTGVFDKEENVFKIYNALGSVASDLVTAPNAITQVPFNIDDNHKLRVYITTNGSLGAVAQFRGLIQLR